MWPKGHRSYLARPSFSGFWEIAWNLSLTQASCGTLDDT